MGMSWEYKSHGNAVTGAVFSDDHQFKSFIWLVRDAASCSIADVFDKERMFGVKLNAGDYARARAMAAVHMFPRRRAQKFAHLDRMMFWNEATLETSSTIGDILDVHCESLHRDIQPDMKRWEALLAQHGHEAFADMAALRVNFPDLLKEEGVRIADIVRARATNLQEMKRTGQCDRGQYPHCGWSGTNSVFILMEPLISAAIEHLTGLWPQRPLQPAEAFELEFDGTKLVSVKQKWIELQAGSDEVFKAE